MPYKRLFTILLSTILLAIASGAKSQTTTSGSIAGAVNDPSGASVSGAKVALRDNGRGGSHETTTNTEGSYRFDLLLPGSYSLTVTASGFQSLRRDVQVAVGQVTAANFVLTLGTASETVTVTEQTPLLNPEEGNLSSTINQVQAANIPNPGNDLTYMPQIAPGSVMNTAGGWLGNFSS